MLSHVRDNVGTRSVIHAKCGHKIELRSNLLCFRAALCATSINKTTASLEECIGYIDCTKIKRNRPGGHNVFQRLVYSSHKIFHCLIQQTVNPFTGLIFELFEPKVNRRHGLTLLRERSWSE